MDKNITYIPRFVFDELKNPKYQIGKEIKNFKFYDENEGADQTVMFFDKDYNYIDPKRFEIENILPEYVLLPKFFWIENLDKLEDFVCIDNSGNKYYLTDFFKEEPKETNLDHLDQQEKSLEAPYCMTAQPRENQVPILEAIYKSREELGYLRGILQAAPGVGKTFMGITIGSSELYQKTLIIVPKNVLVDQWVEAIMNFTDLKEENILILQGSDQDEITKVQDKNIKIIITKPQSLISQLKRNTFFDLYEAYSCIDLVIYDECHSAGATGFSKVTSLFKTNNILGLTATPFRRGINEFLLINSIGDIIIEADAEVLTPDIFIQKIPQSFIKFPDKEMFALKQRLHDYPMMLSLFNMYLNFKKEYLNFLADWVKWARDQDREAVILFSTNKLASNLKKSFEEKFPDHPDEVLMLTGNSKNDALNIAKAQNKKLREELKEYKEELNEKVKNKELKRKEADALYKERRLKFKEIQDLNIEKSIELYHKKIKEAKIIVSNFSLLREGFDKPNLSFVIFGSPVIGKITIVQTLGRITRLYDGKPTPVALFPILEAFESLNKSVEIIIKNNVRSTYPNAKFTLL